MDDHDRVSQASSVATISYFPVIKESDGKVQTFGKRCKSAKRDPNCPVVIRGWLNKKDSSGLKLWKRRWFVLSNYCLFYYKDSREESVLGSIPLPSYKILFCTPRECKNRKFTFKVVHQGMRSYFFSADTQEDMLGWVRALSQSAAMELDGTMNRRCSSYQDFTQIGGSSESVDFPKSPSDEEGHFRKHRHVNRTLSEPSQLSGGRMGRSHSEQRERRSVHQRNSSPSNRMPSPSDFSRRRARAPTKEDDSFPGQNTPPQTETIRGQLGSRPHTPVGRVDIRPHDDPVMVPQTLYYAPASPKLEFRSAPSTPGTERWQNLSKPAPVYGSVHPQGGRRPLGKSCSTGTHADLLPPLPPSSRVAHSPHPSQHHHHHHHHHRSHLSVCVLPPAMAPKPDPREMPPLRPLESDADAVLTRLCGCDKLLQSLSVELAQLQMDKDSVQCALEVSRLQLDEWKIQGPQAYEEALTHKALLQEELVTIRARMCDVSLEMEQVWTQYERMESELSVVRSQLQHICNFGMPQEQSHAQRELWMMEDILDGLKVNRDHFRFLLGLQRHHMFQPSAPHPGSPGSPTERLSMDLEQEPPVRPPLPQELLECQQNRDLGCGWTESPYEGIYSQAVDPAHRRGSSQPDLLNVKAHRDISEFQPGSKWIPPGPTSQPTKKMKVKMSEEEQIERMKKNQERLTNRKKPQLPNSGAQTQGQTSQTGAEAPFPLRVTRVVTAVLPTSLVARRVSVEDPPAELDSLLPEQIPPETQQGRTEQSKKLLGKPPRRLLVESPDQSRLSVEIHQDPVVKKTSREQHPGANRSSKKVPEVSRAERAELVSNSQVPDQTGLGTGRASLDIRPEEQSPALLTADLDPDLSLTPEQREAKLRRVERIRERVIRSAARENPTAHSQLPNMGQGKQAHLGLPDMKRKQRLKADLESHDNFRGDGDNVRTSADLKLAASATSQDENEEHQHVKRSSNQVHFGNKTHHSGRQGVTKTKLKRPGSPYHITSMTVYHKEGGKGFISVKEDEEKKFEEPTVDEHEEDFTSSDLRTKWFLSTNHWKGFIPLQIPGIETLGNEEIVENQPDSLDDITDSNEMSSAVSESLEKMKENHSLFYKIACDINISDSDITKNDGNSNCQSSGPEDKEPLLITESVFAEAAGKAGEPSDQEIKDANQNLVSADNQHPTLTGESENTAASEACPSEIITPKDREDNLRPGRGLNAIETMVEVRVQDISDQMLEASTGVTKEDGVEKESEDRKEDHKGFRVLKKCTSLDKENSEGIQEPGDKLSGGIFSSSCEGTSVIRSASFGKARVTVLRTSL